MTNYTQLIEKIIPFFERFPLQSVLKKKNFEIFKQATNIVNSGRHLTPKGFMEVVELREGLNEGKGRKRKYDKSDVTADYQRILRDYTPNSTLLIENNEMIYSDLCGDTENCTETTKMLYRITDVNRPKVASFLVW